MYLQTRYHVMMGAVSDTPPVTNFSLQNRGTAQRELDIWAKVIYAFKSGDEITLP